MGVAFQFLKGEGVYRYKESGRRVSDQQLYRWVENAAAAGAKNLEKYARQLQKGEISVTEWAISAGEEIRDMHRAAAMIAAGGKNNMSQSDWGFVGSRLRQELSYFNRFVNEIENLPEGAPLPGGFISRAKSYHHAVYETYASALRRRVVANDQARAEKNVLESGAEHCEGCIAATQAGEVPLGTLTPIGERECGSRCLCRIIYVRG
jgi:hypothetical protein